MQPASGSQRLDSLDSQTLAFDTMAANAQKKVRQGRIQRGAADAKRPTSNAGLYGKSLVATHSHLLGKAKMPIISGPQYAFAIAIARGAGAREAFLNAYPLHRTSGLQSVSIAASKLLTNPTVLAWLDFHQRNEIVMQARTLPEHVGQLQRLQNVCLDVGDTASAVRAEMAIGKVSGLYIERSISETNVNVNIGSLEDSLMSRNPALAERLKAARLIADSMDGDVKLLDLAPDVVSKV